MAEEDQQQQQQQQTTGPQRPRMLASRVSVVNDDYEYQPKPVPRPTAFEGAARQTGGMSAQFEIVTSGLDNMV